MTSMSQDSAGTPRPNRPSLSRRQILRQMSLATVGLAVTPVPGWPAHWFRLESEVVPFTDVPEGFNGLRSTAPETFPGQNRAAQDMRELTSWITPADDFFVVTHYGIPELDAGAFTLRVGGEVRRPLTFTLADLKARPRVDRTTVFECGGNSRGLLHGMVGNATWTGTPLLPVLEEAGLTEDAREVHFWGADRGIEEIRGAEYEQNFGRSMSIEEARETEPLLVYEMNGEPLPIVHGFPLRLIVPGWYGVAQVKWLERIDLSPHRLMTRFMARDYVTLMGHEVDGETEWIETSVSRLRPKSVIARVTRVGDRFTIFGGAWSDGTPLERVEVQVGEGPWRATRLDRPGDSFTWSFFTLETEGLGQGEHTLVSRATDRMGRTQPENLTLKRTRWENNELFHRTIRVS